MKNFNNNSRKRNFKGGGSGKKRFSGRDRERPQMHEAICSDCGKKCEVPFKPTGDKPIYCNECFSRHKGNSAFSGSGMKNYERPRFQNKRMFDTICDKCGKKFQLPFNPTGDKPVYCNDCFGRSGSSLGKSDDKVISQYKEQFEMLNAKLDRIIKALVPVVSVKEEKKEVIVEKKSPIVKKKKEAVKKEKKAKKSNSLSKKPVSKKKKVKK